MSQTPAPAPTLERRLGALDAAAIVVSNVIGGGILFTPPQVAAMVLGCASLATFKRLASPDQILDWNGREAALLTPFSSGWAIVVVEQA